jgi:hypothetical protein
MWAHSRPLHASNTLDQHRQFLSSVTMGVLSNVQEGFGDIHPHVLLQEDLMKTSAERYVSEGHLVARRDPWALAKAMRPLPVRV